MEQRQPEPRPCPLGLGSCLPAFATPSRPGTPPARLARGQSSTIFPWKCKCNAFLHMHNSKNTNELLDSCQKIRRGLHMQKVTDINEMPFAALDKLREEMRMSRSRLCRQASISTSTYQRWLRYERRQAGGHCPRPGKLSAVRRVLADEYSNHI